MITVELLYLDGCPSHQQLVERLRLLASEGTDAEIVLRDVTDAEEAERERFLGSPTLRVGGQRDLRLLHTDAGLVVFVSVATPADSTLPAAHQLASQLEDDIREPHRADRHELAR